ncbi:tyrosine-protein phosphatase [Nocardia seriolae]|uniref:Protein-tyrosine-phosphatase n=1 Tax=Nocardia seriolae TaxID=37332 RepID=A0ABC8B0V2_9NOCA|nr:tyrosine-protein phosphatase [Nocardia seriolae]APA99866.1 Protein-tyrosine-phosphatase [Nocardia seriolae]OJF79703.1 tyrosine protein phosphatase [Nocardia seriolae]WKY54978.1 tyrosine-protein phosphatase [Nocardia seriolae]WNJ56827.1 tyrosine-protein phosphatase [Nocardia seriolae]BAW08129.1 tyrosine protein phosphatase [Nocardia seriolae]
MRTRAVQAAAVVTIALSASLGSAATALAADPPAATGSVLVNTDSRVLGLTGVLNARDAGGYRTADGRTVRTGLVFRTGDLSKATGDDLAKLTVDGVVSVHDLRTSYEQQLMGVDKIPAGATAHHDDIIGQAPPQVMASTLSAGTDLYRAFITAPGASEGFANVLRDIAYNPGGVLFHCTAGKDRTGWTSAVLLTILGVDKDTVYYDYLLSNYYRGAKDGDMMNGVTAAALDSAFDQVNQSYGSFDNYVRDGLQLSDADVAALKAKLLS